MSTPDHEAIDELLAGYALRSLDEADAREAERLLADHVPGCLRCRETLAAFQDVLGELGLTARPVEPPDLLLARLRTGITGTPEAVATWARPRRTLASLVATAAAVAVLGLVGWNAMLNQRLGHVQSQQQDVARAAVLMNQPGSKVVGLQDTQLTSSHVLFGYRPDEAQVVLFGTEVPEPSSGREYRLWLGDGGQYDYVGNFEPDGGIVVLTVRFDASRYDQILITEEPTGDPTSAPHGSHRWSATLAPAA